MCKKFLAKFVGPVCAHTLFIVGTVRLEFWEQSGTHTLFVAMPVCLEFLGQSGTIYGTLFFPACPRYSNKSDFVEALRQFRQKELACPLLMNAVRCGVASVIPVQLLSLLTAEDLSLRVCGLPIIDLDYLKVRVLLSRAM